VDTHAPSLDLSDNGQWRQLEARPRNETYYLARNVNIAGIDRRYRILTCIKKSVLIDRGYLTF